MSTPLSPQEKQIIERELIANENAQAKKRQLLGLIHAIGFAAGFFGMVGLSFRGAPSHFQGFAADFLGMVDLWLSRATIFRVIAICVWALFSAIYADLFSMPQSVSLEEALRRLKEDGRQTKALVLLTAPTLGWLASLLLLVLLKMIGVISTSGE